jgi:AraC-like DNA-binding protein
VDIRAQRAREHHRESVRLGEQAARHREQRDRLVRLLRADDPQQWTYPALAAAVGCSPELVAHIVRTTPGTQKEARATHDG